MYSIAELVDVYRPFLGITYEFDGIGRRSTWDCGSHVLVMWHLSDMPLMFQERVGH